MNRRDFACRLLVLTAGITAILAGCEKREERATIAPPPRPAESPVQTQTETPTPEPTETPVAAETPAPPPVDVAPQAPYGELSPSQRSRLTVMGTLSGVSGGETKRWAENLSYDATGTERELRIWEAIAAGFASYTQKNPGINDAAKQEAFNVLLTASLVPPAHLLRYVKVTALSAQEAKAVAALYIPPSGSASPTS